MYMQQELKRRGISCSTLALRDLMIDSVAGALDKSKENLFILHSERFQHVRILLPHLAKLQDNGYRVRLVSQYSWQKESIGVPQVYTSIFTAGSDCEAYDAQWLLFFGREHVSEAPRYDLLGYDLMNALIQRAKGASGETAGLQSDIRWQQVENGGWQNANVKVIEN